MQSIANSINFVVPILLVPQGWNSREVACWNVEGRDADKRFGITLCCSSILHQFLGLSPEIVTLLWTQKAFHFMESIFIKLLNLLPG